MRRGVSRLQSGGEYEGEAARRVFLNERIVPSLGVSRGDQKWFVVRIGVYRPHAATMLELTRDFPTTPRALAIESDVRGVRNKTGLDHGADEGKEIVVHRD